MFCRGNCLAHARLQRHCTCNSLCLGQSCIAASGRWWIQCSAHSCVCRQLPDRSDLPGRIDTPGYEKQKLSTAIEDGSSHAVAAGISLNLYMAPGCEHIICALQHGAAFVECSVCHKMVSSSPKALLIAGVWKGACSLACCQALALYQLCMTFTNTFMCQVLLMMFDTPPHPHSCPPPPSVSLVCVAPLVHSCLCKPAVCI